MLDKTNIFQTSGSLIFNLRETGRYTNIRNEEGKLVDSKPELENDFTLQVNVNFSKNKGLYNNERLQAFVEHVTNLLNQHPFE